LDYRSSKPSVIYSQGRELELRFRRTARSGYNFKIVITAFIESKLFKCLYFWGFNCKWIGTWIFI